MCNSYAIAKCMTCFTFRHVQVLRGVTAQLAGAAGGEGGGPDGARVRRVPEPGPALAARGRRALHLLVSLITVSYVCCVTV